jgi:hypothetical protein
LTSAEPLFHRLINYTPHRSYNHTASAEKWTSIISLADKWQFETMKYVAFKVYIALPDVDAADKIAIGQRYEFPREDLFDVYFGMSTRSKCLSMKQGHKVGLETLARIAQTREEIRVRSESLYLSDDQKKDIITNNLVNLQPSYYHR